MFIAVYRKRLDPLAPRPEPPLLGNDVAAAAAADAGYAPVAGRRAARKTVTTRVDLHYNLRHDAHVVESGRPPGAAAAHGAGRARLYDDCVRITRRTIGDAERSWRRHAWLLSLARRARDEALHEQGLLVLFDDADEFVRAKDFLAALRCVVAARRRGVEARPGQRRRETPAK